MTDLGLVVDRKHHVIYAEFLCTTNMDKDEIILQEGETIAYRWISAEELKRMSRDELVTRRIQLFVKELRW